MISPKEFVDTLTDRGFFDFTGVPCSFFQAAINTVLDDRHLNYTIVPNEGAALALAAGAYLAGKPTVLMIQNSGFGNLVNPLTSLNMIYRIPALIFMSGRAYGVKDEPQHEIIGKTMGPALDALGVRHSDMPKTPAGYRAALREACAFMNKHKLPFVFFVRQGTIDEYVREKKNPVKYPMKRIDAIRIIAGILRHGEYVIATTGKPSRELFSVSDGPRNFYMQGSMGHAAAIGLGAALAQPKQKIVVLDGDGAALMHLGIFSSIGHYRPKNLCHIVLDNESYETTGDQDTTSASTDFTAIAKAAGYRVSEEASNEIELKMRLKRLLAASGPSFLRVKINRLPTGEIPRISSKHDSEFIALRFRDELAGEDLE